MIPSVALKREILLKIGEQLRVLDIVSDAVPDQFAQLLARLEDHRFDIHLGKWRSATRSGLPLGVESMAGGRSHINPQRAAGQRNAPCRSCPTIR